MKARLKESGEIFDIETVSLRLTGKVLSSFGLNEVEVLMPDLTPDYWTRLEHHYAGMAMNALLLTNNIRNGDLEGMRECNTNAMAIAHALVEKLKENNV